MFDWLFGNFAVPALMGVMGSDEQAEYIRANGTSCGLFTPIAAAEVADEQQTAERVVVRQVRWFTFERDAALPFWDAAPETGGSVVYQGITYHVDAVELRDESMVVLRGVRRPVHESARPGYRRAGR